jgi:DnaJ family protein C protein 27
MGTASSGKSCLIKRYCEERFISKYISTIGVDYGVKPTTINGRDVRVNFWDMAGGDDFFEVRNEFYKDASGAILVYDVSDRKTFDDLPKWIAEARKFGAASDTSSNVLSMPVFLVGNKCDKKRAVSETEGQDFASMNGLAAHWETSANSGANVADMFEGLFKTILERPPYG